VEEVGDGSAGRQELGVGEDLKVQVRAVDSNLGKSDM
jgi:hypothetical protein